jgi:hypothetical protein
VTPAPTARTIDIAALHSRIEEDPPRILDVYTPAEFETAHIPGSYNVPLGLPASTGTNWPGTGLAVAAISDTCVIGVALAKMPWNRPATGIVVDAVLHALSDNA